MLFISLDSLVSIRSPKDRILVLKSGKAKIFQVNHPKNDKLKRSKYWKSKTPQANIPIGEYSAL